VREARQHAERVRNQAEDNLEESQRTQRKLDQQQAELAQRSELLEAEAQKSLEERVRNALREVEGTRTLTEQAPKELARRLTERLDALEYQLTGAALSDKREAFLSDLAKGKLVYLPRYRQRVIVQKVDRKNRTVSVKLGTMSMKVGFDEVTMYESL